MRWFTVWCSMRTRGGSLAPVTVEPFTYSPSLMKKLESILVHYGLRSWTSRLISIHLFALWFIGFIPFTKGRLTEGQTTDVQQNPKSKLSGVLFFIPYFSQDLSFAKSSITDASKPSKVAFKDPFSIVVVTYDKGYYQSPIPITGGEFTIRRENIQEMDGSA